MNGLVVTGVELGGGKTRAGPGASNHSIEIIDLALSSPNIELNWSIAEEDATGSEHEVMVWEVLGDQPASRKTSKETTGWDIRGWVPQERAAEIERQ